MIIIALCYLSLPVAAQGKGDDLQKQAMESLEKKEYIRARYMFLQAYNAYIGAAQYEQAVACGVQASALYHRENYYNEAFELLYSVEQNLIDGEQKTGRQMPALRYPITRERLQMYIKLRKSASAKDQLAKLKGWAEAAKIDSLATDLLYTQANYYYTFGQTQQGDAAFNALVQRYAEQKDYDKARACYKEMIAMGRRSGSVPLVTRAYDKYMAWNDSIRAIEAQEKYDELKAQYDIMKKIGEGTDESLKAGLRLPVYIFNVNGQTIRVVPCYGAGLWGPIWGYLAFTEDMNTLDGAVFDHKGETPGLGAEIALPKFYDQFGGKQILDENGNFVSVSVVKGGAKGDIHGVDAISGGTITSKALETTMRTWLSFYRPYFTNVINGEE